MQLVSVARLSCLALLMTIPPLHAEEAATGESLATREFHVEHVDVKEANAIVRSILSIRKSAIDVRRQVLVLSDTPDRLDQAAKLVAKVDEAVTEWGLVLIARAAGTETVLRDASITQGRLEVQFGPSPVTTKDNLGVTAVLTRAASGEVDMEWTASLAMTDQWTESAHAVETLHEGAMVTLVKTADPSRQKALARLLGLSGSVDSLVLKITKAGDEATARKGMKP